MKSKEIGDMQKALRMVWKEFEYISPSKYPALTEVIKVLTKYRTPLQTLSSEKKYTEEERDKFAINFGTWLIGRPISDEDLKPYKHSLNEK